MIIFQTLKVQNFKSIKSATLEYASGVWKVVGVNNDATFKSNGSGKALANSEPVLTKGGFKPIGSLTLQDQVIGSDGKPKNVLGIYPQGSRDIYKMTFGD
ncbi:MAG: hypothetical protein U9N61_03240, partial [Euryarchaeota archaeon]|nr:hypothetical protein [Euryarchaeota archaeon]